MIKPKGDGDPIWRGDVTKTLPRSVTKTRPEVSVTPRQEIAKRVVAAVVNRGGRPKKLNVLTPAQKQAAYRERKCHG